MSVSIAGELIRTRIGEEGVTGLSDGIGQYPGGAGCGEEQSPCLSVGSSGVAAEELPTPPVRKTLAFARQFGPLDPERARSLPTGHPRPLRGVVAGGDQAENGACDVGVIRRASELINPFLGFAQHPVSVQNESSSAWIGVSRGQCEIRTTSGDPEARVSFPGVWVRVRFSP
jgi:hypothetical protein